MRQSIRTWVSLALPAALAGGALLLPWTGRTASVFVLGAAGVTEEAGTSANGVALLPGVVVVAVVMAAIGTIATALAMAWEPWWWAAATGVLTTAVAVVASGRYGLTPGSALMLVAGVFLLVRACLGLGWKRSRPAVLAVLVLALPAWLLTAGFGGDETASVLAARGTVRGPADLVPANHGVAVVTAGEVFLAVDGELTRLAVIEERGVTVLGIAGGRLVYHRADSRELRIVPLDGDVARPAIVTGVAAADSMTEAGLLLFRTMEWSSPTLRRLDVTRVEPGRRILADTIEEVRVPGTRSLVETDDPQQPMRFVETPGTDEIAVVDNTELHAPVLLTARDGRWQPVTNLHDYGCVGDISVSDMGGVVAPDSRGGWWQFSKRNGFLDHVSAAGVSRARLDLPGTPTAMTASWDGTLHLLTEDGLWRVPPPPTRPRPGDGGCPPAAVVGPPLRLDPFSRDRVDVPLDMTGRGLVAVDGQVELVTAEGTRKLPVQAPAEPFTAGSVPWQVVADGTGGFWAIEDSTRLVHVNAAGVVDDRRPVELPLTGGLQPDLSGGVPYLGLCPPVRAGTTSRPPVGEPAQRDGCWDSVLTVPDGRTWFSVDYRLYSAGPDGVTTVIDHPESPPLSVTAALAAGTPPAEVPLYSATLGPDRDGGLLIAAEGVLLRVTQAGEVLVFAHDERLWGARLLPVVGGSVLRLADGTLHRLRY